MRRSAAGAASGRSNQQQYDHASSSSSDEYYSSEDDLRYHYPSDTGEDSDDDNNDDNCNESDEEDYDDYLRYRQEQLLFEAAIRRSHPNQHEYTATAGRTNRSSSTAASSRSASTVASPALLSPASVPQAPSLCRFFVLGKCRYGSHCTYSHVLPASATDCSTTEAEGLTAAAAQVDCPFFQRGNCKYGDYCRLRHNRSIPTSLPSTLSASSGSSNNQINSNHSNAQEYTCGICFEDIVESGKYFGLLSCDHCFCLDCLRLWRQSKDMEVEVIRACPACRVPSNYIVPSLHFCTGEEKKKVVEAYKSHLAIRECKYFNGLFGSCPFGPHCFYAHRDSEGRDVKHLDRPKRNTKGRNGRNASLSSMFGGYSQLFRLLESFDWDDYHHDYDTDD